MGAIGMFVSRMFATEKVIQVLTMTCDHLWEMECRSSPLHDLSSNLCPRFRRQLSEPCNSFPPLPAMPREGRPIYQRQMSEPNIPFPPQGFKQEYHDPVYEHNAMVGSAASQNFPPPLMIKQEPRDFAYDSGRWDSPLVLHSKVIYESKPVLLVFWSYKLKLAFLASKSSRVNYVWDSLHNSKIATW